MLAELRIRRFAAASESSQEYNEPQLDFTGGGESVVGRIYTVSGRERERYYFRKQLHHITGSTSLKDMQTGEENVCATCPEACQRLVILADDLE